MAKINSKQLTAQQLAPYVGNLCFINNGRSVKLAQLNYMMLYEHDKGSTRQIVLILNKLSSISPSQGDWISKQPYYTDGFALNFIKKVAGDLFNFHLFVSEWWGTDCYVDLMGMGLDVFGLIEKGSAIDGSQEFLKEYSVDEFQELFF